MRAPSVTWTLLACLALSGAVACSSPSPQRGEGSVQPATPDEVEPDSLDLSGVAWLDDDTFLGVHDSKDEGRPRVSVVELPAADDDRQKAWRTVDVDWGEGGAPQDMESAARLPGTDLVLLAESGQVIEDDEQFKRLFLVEYADGALQLKETVEWPAGIENVEGTAVARVGERLVFLYAERAQGKAATTIHWAHLRTDPVRFDDFNKVTLPNPEPVGPESRPVSAIDVDDAGAIYIASALDPDIDNGPFSSDVWLIGHVRADGNDDEVTLESKPEHLGKADGLKIESVAVRPDGDGQTQVIVGSDDENFGGVLRPLPPAQGS